MREINPNYWAPHNQEWAPHYGEWSAPIPISDLPTLASGDNLYDGFYLYNAGGPAKFYYRLVGAVLRNILDEENNYFYENY